MGLILPPERFRLHLDASDDTTISVDGSNRVTQWRDKSAGARHHSERVGHGKPLRVNGAVRFDPTIIDALITEPSDARILRYSGNLAGSYPFDIFAVLSTVNTPNNVHGPIISIDGSLTQYEYLYQRGVNYRGSLNSNIGLGVDWSNDQSHLINARLTSNTQFIASDLILSNSGSTGARSFYSGLSVLGAEREVITGFPASQFSGDMHEIIVLTQATDSERASITGYLADKWYIPYLSLLSVSSINPSLYDQHYTEISSRAIDLRGVQQPRVVVFNWDHPYVFQTATIDADGYWNGVLALKGRPFGVYYLSHDNRCPPICHGPYTL